MVENQLTLLSDMEGIRPDDVKKAVENAEKAGIVVAESEQFQAAFAHLFAEFKKREERYSPNTLRRLESAWTNFVEWCLENKVHSLPCSPKNVEKFFIDKSTELHRNTLSVYRWAISRVHRITGCPDPCLDSFVDDRLKAIRRKKVKGGEAIKQATPFNEMHLEQLQDVWGVSERVLTLRNLAIMAVAYESMLREAELANIRLEDIEIEEDGYAILTIPITKTNHSGEPDTCVLTPAVVGMIQKYASAGDMRMDGDGYLFTGVSKHNVCMKNGNRVSEKTIYNVFRDAFKALGLTGRAFSGHSARVGATQDLLKKGFTTLEVQQSGRWSSGAMVARYGRAILARESAMAKARAER